LRATSATSAPSWVVGAPDAVRAYLTRDTVARLLLALLGLFFLLLFFAATRLCLFARRSIESITGPVSVVTLVNHVLSLRVWVAE
jgi:hypothetical protein